MPSDPTQAPPLPYRLSLTQFTNIKRRKNQYLPYTLTYPKPMTQSRIKSYSISSNTTFNFSTHTTNFFNSYFHNRQQSTHTQHAKSKTQTITHGIPQGSTLSTTLFLLYINDIIKTTPNSKVYTFADDTTLIITSNSLQELETLAQSELSNLISYFHNNNLVPNPTKTNYSIFHPKHAQPIELTINDTLLKKNNQAKLLGLTVQDNLKHHQTINNIIKNIQPITYSFRHANKLLPRETMKQLYYNHVYPHLISNISIWGSQRNTKTYLQPLIKMQKKIIRLITNLPPKTHTAPLMKQLRILNLCNLYTLRVCVEMHPFIHPTKHVNRPEHNHDYISATDIHDYKTRYSHNKHLYSPSATNTNHFTGTYIKVWNSLPAHIRSISSKETFKRATKDYLLNQQ